MGKEDQDSRSKVRIKHEIEEDEIEGIEMEKMNIGASAKK